MKKFLSILFAVTTGFLISCSQESPTVDPSAIINSYFSNPSGTINMLAYFAYPIDTDTNIPVDAKLIIVFSKNAQDATIAGNVTVTGSISGAHAYTTGGVDGKVITLTPTILFNPSETITVNVGTGVTSTVADDSRPLATSYTWTFSTAATSTAALPRVIFGTQYPANGATGISVNQNYAEITFNKTMGASATVAGNYTIDNGASISSVVQIGTTNTYKINLNIPLSYATTYTIALTNSILDSGGTALQLDGNHTWSFATENALPVPPALALNSYSVTGVNDTSVTLNWITNRAVDSSISRSQYRYSTNTTFGAWQNYTPAGLNEVHAMNLTPLTEGTKYYYEIQASTDGITWVTASGSFNTKYTNPVTSNGGAALASTAGRDNSEMSTVQRTTAYNTYDGSSFVVWKTTTDNNIYGNFIDNDSAPTIRWTANGETIRSGLASAPSNVRVYSDQNSRAVFVYENGGTVYAKSIYNNAGSVAYTGSNWGANSAATGITVGTGTNATASAISSVAGVNPNRLFFAYESGGVIYGTIVDSATGGTGYSNSGFQITNNGTSTNPKTSIRLNAATQFSSVFVIYENGGNIYGKRMNSTGGFTVGTDAANIGLLIGTGTLLNLKSYSDGAGGSWGYVLYQNGGNVVLSRVNQSFTDTGNTEWTYTAAGSSPSMDVDYFTGDSFLTYISANNLIVVRLTPASNGTATYNYSIPLSTIVSNIKNPKIITVGGGEAVVGWFDDRYYSTLGLCLFRQYFNSTGTPQWDADSSGSTDYRGILVAITSIYGYTSTSLGMLFYNDAGALAAPFGALFFWADRRNSRNDFYYYPKPVP